MTFAGTDQAWLYLCLPARRVLCLLSVLLGLGLGGCSSSQSHSSIVSNQNEPAADELFQTSADRVATISMRSNLNALYLLMDKLYRRNPREWRKTGVTSRLAAEQHIHWAIEQQQPLRGLGGRKDVAALAFALGESFHGDRVGAFIYSLGSMLITAHGGRTRFYMTDSLDPEYIHNAARNMEKASWMLANRKDARGQPWLLSNEISEQGNNLSYAVEFGKIIARLDLLTDVLDESTRRIGVGYAQSLLFMNFLPVQ
jgi:hypothetical protein